MNSMYVLDTTTTTTNASNKFVVITSVFYFFNRDEDVSVDVFERMVSPRHAYKTTWDCR